MSNQADLDQAIKRVVKAIAKKQAKVKELDQENLQVTQGDRSVIVRINQFNNSESTIEYR